LALFLCNFYGMHLPVSLLAPRTILFPTSLTPFHSSLRTYRTVTSSPTAISTSSESPRSTTARSSRSASTTG
jgi:hypothetical protein